MSTCDGGAPAAPGTGRGTGRRRGRLRRCAARIREDLDVVLEKDPAARSRWEVLLYPHIHALWLHRVANWLHRRDRVFLARAVSLYARRRTGVDIHPGATIGRRFFVDHGAGVVIGETAVIGDDVMLYHQVTLGSAGWWKDRDRAPGARRHPVIGDRVVIGTSASVLGPVTVGRDCLIGAHVLLTESVPAHSRVLQPPAAALPRTSPAGGAGSPAGPPAANPPAAAPAPAPQPSGTAPAALGDLAPAPAARLVRTTQGSMPR
ncbi:serine O-acetyltransferase EpsC [Actinacidiphila sp. ITFR-21]|uniref:serine O-acetyltransferase EpsC n=1 Tax=Actinacidiphila sp. ITFR-21 TaxID=3075199 RepID=UPI00288C2585|nr:serine O-acetyltransferase EpsC [Streptomyces sp. ITFR-21]WNI14317.1 serine O-acetyltransferase EpsC [Streptomyces sp. ITFR-21]